MVDRVATYSQTAKISSDLMRLQSNYSKGVEQQSSGLKSDTYQGLAGNVQKLLSLESDYNEIAAYSESGQTALDRINSMTGLLGNITDMATSIRSILSSSISGTGIDDTTLQSQASQYWDELTSYLNTQQNGIYLFGGGASDTAPVNKDDPDYLAASAPSAASTTYYQGGDYIAQVTLGQDTTLSYGVTASDPAFEKMMRALNLVANNPNDTNALQEAYDLLGDATTDLTSLQSTLSTKASTIDTKINSYTDDLNTLDGLISDIKNVDLSSLLVRLTSLEAQIEASYSVSSDILKLKLSDYL